MTVIGLLSVARAIGGGVHAQADGARITMVDGPGDAATVWKFEPPEITVPADSSVTWHDNGQQAHTATADDGSFDTGYVGPGGDTELTFSKVGDYAYHCTPHPWMKAVVHVTAPAASPTTTSAPTSTTKPAGSPAAPVVAAPSKPSPATTTTIAAPSAVAPTTSTGPAGTPAPVTATTAPLPAVPAHPPAATADTGVMATATTSGPAIANNGAEDAAANTERAAGVPQRARSGRTDGPLVAFAALTTMLLVGISVRLLIAPYRPH